MSDSRGFRFGVVCLGAISRAGWVEKARRAEDLGYATLLVPDHLGNQFAPVPALLTAAAVTTHLRVGSLVLANDFRHPAILAKEAATVDVLSEGRFEFGLGTGWLQADYAQIGITFETPGVRIRRLAEALDIIQALFTTQGPVTRAGTHYNITELHGLPRPVQQPRPPILVGGGGPKLLTLAARVADIVSIAPRARVDGKGLELADMTVAAVAQKVAWIRAAAADRMGQIELNMLVQQVIIGADRQAAAAYLARRYGVSSEVMLTTPYVLLGTAAQIEEELLRRREQYGISYIAIFEPSIDALAPVVTRLAGS